jgi:hypothetical protein
MANWWDEDPIVETKGEVSPTSPSMGASPEGNWWDEDEVVGGTDAQPTLAAPTEPVEAQERSWQDYVGGLDNPEKLQRDIDDNNDQRLQNEGLVPVDDLLQSQDDLYDSIHNDPAFAKLREYESSIPYNIFNVTTKNAQTGDSQTWAPFAGGAMPPELQKLKKIREEELLRKYESTGTKDSLAGIPIRTQEIRKNNPDYDPSRPTGPDNQPMTSQRYMLDPPDREALTRMGYQVLENIVGGGLDAVTEGKFTTEGSYGKHMPETIPNNVGEQFATDVTTFIIGPTALAKVGKGVGSMVLGDSAALASKVGQMMSPEAMNTARVIYQNTLSRTGNAAQAFKASNSYVKRAIVGLSIGVGETVVAPDSSEGIVSPETIQEITGLSKERARDMGMVLESPIVAGVASSLGRLYMTARDKVVMPTVGGLRNVNIFGFNAGSKIPLNEKAAGLKTLTWLDPNLTGVAPEEAAFKIKILGDSLQRNAILNAQLAGAGQKIELDTPAAFTRIAQDYYELAYANLKDQLSPEEFKAFVQKESTATASRLYELRTAVLGEQEVFNQAAKNADQIEQLFDEGANKLTREGLVDAQMKGGQILGNAQIAKTIDAESSMIMAEREAQAARAASDTAITGDDEFRLFLEEIDSAPLGSRKALNDKVQGNITEKTYGALKKLKGESDEAYQKIADSGAQGDASSILGIIRGDAGTVPVNTTTGRGNLDEVLNNDPEAAEMYKKLGGPLKAESSGVPDKVAEITDPFLKKIANSVEKDDSFGNIYNNIRNDINKRIKRLENSNSNDPTLQTLYDLRDDINEHQLDFVRKSGGADVQVMVDEAKQKFQLLRQAFYDNKPLGKISDTGVDRMAADPNLGSKMPVGPDGRPQRETDFKIELSRHVQNAFEGSEGELFRDSLQRATKLGGNDITPELNDLYVSKALGNLANKISVGDKQNVNTLRQSLRGIIEPLQGLNSPMVAKFQRLEQKIQSLENVAINREEYFSQVKADVERLKSEAADSILNKFLYKGNAQSQSSTGATLKQIFNSPKGVDQVKELLKEVSALGEQGNIVREAIQGTYIDNLADRLISKRPIGISDVQDGAVKNAFKINETNFERVFSEGSRDMEVMTEIFKDKPAILSEIREISKSYLNITKTTPRARGNVLGETDRSLNPELAMNSVRSLIFGPLSRTGTQVGKLTGPLSVESLEQVRAANKKTLIAMLTDPTEFNRIATEVRKGIVNDKLRADMNALIIRGLAREKSTGVDDEMGRLK